MAEFNYAEDEPPTVPEAKGHPHHRGQLINFVALRHAVTDRRDAARNTLHKVDRIINEEVETQRTLTEVVKSETVRLLEGLGFVSEGTHAEKESLAREQIEAKLAANRRAAETAKAARPEVERRIALHDRQLELLAKRKDDFLLPALREMAECLGPVYIKRVQAVRDVMQILFALGERMHGWGKIERKILVPDPRDSWSRLERSIPEIKLPRAGLDTLKLVPDERFAIKLGAANPWDDIAAALLDDPTKPVALPSLAA
jgi:hypothetical protein